MLFFKKRPPAERDGFKIPRTAQATIPIRRIYRDGAWDLGGGQHSRTWRFSDINYFTANIEDQKSLLQLWGGVLNSQPSDSNLKITLLNHGMNPDAFRASLLIPHKTDGLDRYRWEYNQTLLDKAAGVNGIIQEKYITVSTRQKSVEGARSLLNRVGGDLAAGMGRLGSGLTSLDCGERLRVLHDFFRPGEETSFSFDLTDLIKKGHDFKDLICPDSVQFKSNYFELGDSKVGRVLWIPYGLDCTGLLDWSFRNAGLPSAGHWYLETNLTETTWDEAQPGDIALFPDDSHVGLVVGRDGSGRVLVVHCSFGLNNVAISDAQAFGFTKVGVPRVYG